MGRQAEVSPRVPRAATIWGMIVLTLSSAAHAGSERPSTEAAAPPANGGPVTEVEVTWQKLAALVEKHPRIAAGRHRVAAARAAEGAAGAVANPELEATGAYGQAVDGSASRIEWGLGLSIPLGWLAQRGAKMDAARAEARAAAAEVRALRRDVLLELRLLFWNLVYQQHRVEALDQTSQQTGALVQAVRRRAETGEVRPVEATRVEIEAERVAGELEVARLGLEARRARLATWLGVGSDRRLVAVADLYQLPRPISAGKARERVRAGHPALLASRARVDALAADLAVERTERIPEASIAAFTDHELDRRAYGVGLSLQLPLWNWNTDNIRRSERLLAAGKELLRAELLQLEGAVIEAGSSCRAEVALSLRYRDGIVPRAESSARIIERTYHLGEATLLEMIDSRRTLLDTKREFLEALVRAQIECGRLAALTEEGLP